MRTRFTPSGLLASLLGAGLCLGAAALNATAAATPFDVQIYDRTENRFLPTYEFQGRTYVVGKPGNEYALTLRNQSGERLLAVGSVDGVNIVSGETASPAQTGYVLSPWQSAEIKGWRKSLSHTAAFYFTDHDNSYAARTGRPNDVGVIGVAVFRERRAAPPPPIPYPQPRPWNERDDSRPYGSVVPHKESAAASADAAQPAPASPSAAQSESFRRQEKSLGTGHGRPEQSQTRYTDFQRASSRPDQVITIYYDTYSNLLAMGVPVWRVDRDYAGRNPHPRPFPRNPTYGFVPDPR
jgi:hypothetical protein